MITATFALKKKQMKNILLINGHEFYEFAKGQYNQTLFKVHEDILSKQFNITKTIIEDGYDIAEEQEKFKRADIIVFQFPVYWFGMPAALKKYIDVVYAYGVFFGMGNESSQAGEQPKYGFSNGLMPGKKYMLSITTNAPNEVFNDEDGFFEGKDLEGFLFNVHKTHQFCGMTPLKSFAADNVIKNPQPEAHSKDLEVHLKSTIVTPFAKPRQAAKL
ncbi:modulator of drug activity B [Microscilla marina ATCC 23134]|uniref:Modulator of drug activity B n=2 Tax=Microscilla marina TaxID=1027 RepID=A1ZQN4_MICM2|nr:modulator of drug activity B [Microscilla marina ATCC 23134]